MAPCSLISISSLSILWLSSIVFSGIPDLTDDQLYELVVTNNKNDHEFVKCTFADQTTNPIYIEVRPDWAPLGAARFVELVKDGHFWYVAIILYCSFTLVSEYIPSSLIYNPFVIGKWQCLED